MLLEDLNFLAVNKILITTKAPTTEQAKMVATILAKRVIAAHYELG